MSSDDLRRAEYRRAMEGRLRAVEGYLAAIERRAETIAIVGDSEDRTSAITALAEHLHISADQAADAVQLHLMQFTRRDAVHFSREREELIERIKMDDRGELFGDE